MCQHEFPTPTRLGGRLYWNRADLENFKRALLGLPQIAANESARIELVPASQVTSEFGFGRRTLGRRVANRAGETGSSANMAVV